MLTFFLYFKAKNRKVDDEHKSNSLIVCRSCGYHSNQKDFYDSHVCTGVMNVCEMKKCIQILTKNIQSTNAPAPPLPPSATLPPPPPPPPPSLLSTSLLPMPKSTKPTAKKQPSTKGNLVNELEEVLK